MKSEPQATMIAARILGPLLLVTAGVFVFEPSRIIAIIPAFFGNDALALIAGFLALGFGLVLLAFHLKFGSPTQIVITVIGFIGLVRGGLLLFWPHFIQKVAQYLYLAPQILPIAAVFAALLGLWLSYVGWLGKPQS